MRIVLPPKLIENKLTRQADLLFSLKSNTIVHRAKLESRWPGTMCIFWKEHLKLLEILPIFSASDNFPTIIRCMAWCMQKLSSIHRPRKKIEVRTGLHHAVGAPWWTCKMMIFELRWHRTELSPRAFESPFKLTRRNGLSSWKVILFVTAGMLSGK